MNRSDINKNLDEGVKVIITDGNSKIPSTAKEPPMSMTESEIE